MYKALTACRICGGKDLVKILDLGEQVLTGVFPKQRDQQITKGPLQLLKCTAEQGCGLVQLAHSYDLGEMYGENYGYRSGLNASMVAHLKAKVARIQSLVTLRPGDLVIDIGSNDGTTLSAYPSDLRLVGIDPTGSKFRQYYPAHVSLIPDFFSAALFRKAFPGVQAKVVTSFSMYYDLEAPMDFMQQVFDVLDVGGIWVFEQSYLATMLEKNSYDTACHEHLEYYALQQIKWMADRVGFEMIDIEFNDVNGGSFSVVARKPSASVSGVTSAIQAVLDEEKRIGLDTLAPYLAFEQRVERSREDLSAFLAKAQRDGKTVAALGASTKGNVLLQYCRLTEKDLSCVAEVNPDKFGTFTPGSLIPIVDQTEVVQQGYDYLVVLPWHFRSFFDVSAKLAGQTLVYPLPTLEVVKVSARP